MIALYVAIGGAIGSVLRYFVVAKTADIAGSVFPYGTMIVNIFGSFVMGLFIGYMAKSLPHSVELRAFVVVGILGGFTTFSAFSLDFITLFENGNYINALLYAVFSVIVSILAVFCGLWVMRSLGF